MSIVALVFLVCSGLSPDTRPSPASLASDVTAPLPIPAEFTGLGIIVPVMINGRRLNFVLDSGASRVSVDQNVAAQIGLGAADYRKARGDGSDWSRGHTRIAELRAGPYVEKDVDAWTLDFRHENVDKRVVGLLGWQFFTGHRVEIDFTEQTVILLPEGAPLDANVWTALDIDLRYNVPLMRAQFNALDGQFVVDTGSFKTLLNQNYVEKFDPKGQAVMQGRFAFGPLEFGDASATVADRPRFETTAYDGLIGRDVLSHFNLIFDYARHTLFVQNRPAIAGRFRCCT